MIKDTFGIQKQQILNELFNGEIDKSPKGFVDDLILPFFDLINKHTDYVTTSSCSGRIAVYSEIDIKSEPGIASSKKKGGCWVLVSHANVQVPNMANDIYSVLRLDEFPLAESGELVGNIYFKFEPFIMHVASRDVESGNVLLKAALEAGFRNSGIVPSADRAIVAIRSSLHLDVPIASIYKNESLTGFSVKHLVSADYLVYLLQLANEKLNVNSARIDRLWQSIDSKLNPIQKKLNWEDPLIRKERKKREGLLRKQNLAAATMTLL